MESTGQISGSSPFEKVEAQVVRLNGYLQHLGFDVPPSLNVKVSTIELKEIPLIQFSMSQNVKRREDYIDSIIGWLAMPLRKSGEHYLYRCSDLASLKRVRNSGVDVIPMDATIYTSPFTKKAIEYLRGGPGIFCAYDESLLSATSIKVIEGDETGRDAEISYPLVCTMESQKYRYRGKAVDVGCFYARWIPGSPWDALKYVFLIEEGEVIGVSAI